MIVIKAKIPIIGYFCTEWLLVVVVVVIWFVWVPVPPVVTVGPEYDVPVVAIDEDGFVFMEVSSDVPVESVWANTDDFITSNAIKVTK